MHPAASWVRGVAGRVTKEGHILRGQRGGGKGAIRCRPLPFSPRWTLVVREIADCVPLWMNELSSSTHFFLHCLSRCCGFPANGGRIFRAIRSGSTRRVRQLLQNNSFEQSTFVENWKNDVSLVAQVFEDWEKLVKISFLIHSKSYDDTKLWNTTVKLMTIIFFRQSVTL